MNKEKTLEWISAEIEKENQKCDNAKSAKIQDNHLAITVGIDRVKEYIMSQPDKLAEYEDTKLTPEQIKAQQHNLGVAYNVIAELEKKLNDWKYDALKATAKLREIRIWLEEEGISVDKYLDKVKGTDPVADKLQEILDAESERFK